MKLYPVHPHLITSALAFALMASAAQTGGRPKSNAQGPIRSAQQNQGQKQQDGPVTTRGKNVSVFLHGLMVGRYKRRGMKRFEVGIVGRAPHHKFSFSVYSDGKCPGSETHADISIDRKTTWRFEIEKDNHPVERDVAMAEDTKYILDVEGEKIHNGKINRYKKAFNRVFYFHNGKVKVKCLTLPLRVKKVESEIEGTATDVGTIAEVVEVGFDQRAEGESLVLKNEDTGQVLWRHYFCNSGEAHARLLNLEPAHEDTVNNRNAAYAGYCCVCPPGSKIIVVEKFEDFNKFLSDRGKARQASSSDEEDPTDFQQYYYLVFKKDRPDRFELLNDNICVIVKEKSPSGVVCIQTTPPYKCGMVLVNKKEIKLN
jgi:hypothetical protein